MSENFVKIADINDIKHSEMKRVQVDNEAICLANVDGILCDWKCLYA